MSYNSKYTGVEVEELLDSIGNKVDKVDGKQLSTEDFTTLLKQKLEGLSNYDDTEIQKSVSKLRTDLDTLVSGDTTTAIKTFNEVIVFLDGISDTEDLSGIIASIEHQIASKQDKITDLDVIRSGAELGATALQSIPSEYVTETELTSKGYATTTLMNTELEKKQDTISDLDDIRSGAALGATALQSYTETDPVFSKSAAAGITSSDISNWNGKTSSTGTVTDIKINGTTKSPTNGVVDLGTVITSHQDISGKANTSDLAKVATSGSYNDLSNKPTIPSAVTESTVSGWGFTKNTGTYSKPSTGIPKSDLASAVQTSLGKADTALQSYTEKYTGTYSKPSGGIPKSDLASAVQNSLGLADKAITTDNLISTFKNFTQNLGIGIGGEYRLHVGSSAAINGTLVLRDNSNALVLFQKADKTRMGYIGMRQADTPIFIKSNASTVCKLVHEGMTELNLNSKKVIDASSNPVFYGTVDSSSDESLKEIQGEIGVSVKQIADAPSVIFTWKNGDGKHHVGTIAQYWKDVLPEVVSGDEGNLRMDYASLGVVNSIILARKVEEQDAVIKELMNEIAELKSRL